MHASKRTSAVLSLILLIPAYTLFSRTSEGGPILSRWSVSYVLILLVYLGVIAGSVLLILRPPQRLHDAIRAFARPVRRFPILYLLRALVFIEAWYAARRWLFVTRFFGAGTDYIALLWFVALLLLFVYLILLFAGRDPEDQRKTAKRAGMIFGGMLIGLVLYSFVYALVIDREDYNIRHQIYGVVTRPDWEIGFSLKPNTEFAIPAEELTLTRTDAQGFRNDNIPTDAPIAGFGDSFMMGFGVSDDETWAAELGQEFDTDVYNYGVYGYALWQYNVLAERHIEPGDHDLVIYSLFANDLGTENRETSEPTRIRRWTITGYKNPISYTLWQVFDQSPVEIFINQIGKIRKQDASATDAPAFEMPYGFPADCKSWTADIDHPNTFAQLDQAMGLAEERGYTLLIVTIPTIESTYYEAFEPVCASLNTKTVQKERRIYDEVCAYIQEQGHHCYNLSEDFGRAAADEAAAIFLSEGHWNRRGHEVFAELVAGFIRKEGLFDKDK